MEYSYKNSTIDFYIKEIKFNYLWFESLDMSFEKVKKLIINDNYSYFGEFKKYKKIQDQIDININEDLKKLKEAYNYLFHNGYYPRKPEKVKFNFRVSGVYEIVNIQNYKRYIGKSAIIADRWSSHKTLLKYNHHHCKKLQDDYNKYGIESFRFNVVELEKDPEELHYKERYWWEHIEGEKYNRNDNMCMNSVYDVKFLENKIDDLEKELEKYKRGVKIG